MRVALVYDRVNKWGGAERVLLALHKLFPDAPLYTSVYNKERAKWAEVFNIKTSFLQQFPCASSSHEVYASLMPMAFESFTFDDYDLVISVTSEAAKGIITKPQTLHLCYCLTPTRYLWSGYGEYFKNKTFRLLSKPVVSYLRTWDKIAAQRPDAYISISKEVQGRIKKYYGRESELIYPPIDIGAEVAHKNFLVAHAKKQESKSRDFDPANSHSENFVSSPRQQKYFLIVSRLVPYKRIDLAIDACNRLQLPLKIVGTGGEEKRLKSMAGPTVEFLGNLTDSELVGYYKNCHSLIFPAHEDLGLAILEAQSFGKPVIAFRGGGALETVIEGKTGVFFHTQRTDSLIEVLEKFNITHYDPEDCMKQAEKFTMDKFITQFKTSVSESVKKYKQ